MMIEIIENCQLEWDQDRGVLYVHNKDTGATVLRICRLDRFYNFGEVLHKYGQIDMTGPFDRVSYPLTEKIKKD